MIAKLLLFCLGLVVPALGARPFVIGGSIVGSMSTYPHQCSLIESGSHSCGASIISKDWLVTAAHCVSPLFNEPSSFSVKCGNLKWRDGTKYSISTIIMHDDYEIGLLSNDIAVLKVSSSMDLSGANMKAITMATTEQAGNSECYITGWGITETGGGGDIPEDLMEAKINVYTNKYCKGKWILSDINDGNVCIGDTGKGACNGDSGGPLMCKVDGQFQLVGATSWGSVNCNTYYPSVYSRISYFREWIKGKTGV